MEELQNRDDMEDEKTFVRNFFKKRMIWINKDHYCFLTHKKYRIAILILKKLLELEKCSQKKIVSEIKKDLEIYVKDVLKKYNNNIALIKASKDKGILIKEINKNKYYITSFDSAIKGTLTDMVGFLLNKKTIWARDKSEPPASIYCLNKNGKKLVQMVIEKEKTSENIVENQ